MKHKIKVKDLTLGAYYSLQDASDELAVPKNEVYDAAKAAGMIVGLLFNKYTIFSKIQIDQLKGLTRRII